MLTDKKTVGCSIAIIILAMIIFARNTYGPLPFVPVILGISSVFFLAIGCIDCFRGHNR